MTQPIDVLTKTCAVCGLKKPLAAFLQLSGPQGRSYGNICSTCRKEQIEKEKEQAPKEPEEVMAAKLHLTIDAKAKVFEAVSKREKQALTKETEEKERQKQQLLESTKTQKKLTTAKDERTHRESMFDKHHADRSKQTQASTNVVGGVTQAAKARHISAIAPSDIFRFGLTNTLNSETAQRYFAWLGVDSAFSKGSRKAVEKVLGEKISPEEEREITPHPSSTKKG